MTALRKEYPQAELSRQLLVTALLELMKKKDYKNISVSELSEAADVARRTFYRHFQTIDDVLEYYLKELTDDFVVFFGQRYDHTSLREIVTVFFSFWEKHRDFLLLLKKNHMLYVLSDSVLPAMRKEIRRIGLGTSDFELTEDEASSFPDLKEKQFYMESIFYFMSGGVLSLLTRWLDARLAPSASEMGEIALSAVNYFSS